MKNLYLNVNCISEHCGEFPDSVHVQLSDEMVERIVMLSSWIRQAKSYRMSEFFGADYYNLSSLDLDDEFNPDMLDSPMRTDCDMIHVVNRWDDEYYVYFTSIPKHCSDTEELISEYVDIKDILEHDVINKIEL